MKSPDYENKMKPLPDNKQAQPSGYADIEKVMGQSKVDTLKSLLRDTWYLLNSYADIVTYDEKLTDSKQKLDRRIEAVLREEETTCNNPTE